MLTEAAAPYKISRHESQRGSEAEFAMLEERARGAGLRLAEWVREALLAALVEPGVDSGEVALGEILALRSLLLNLHFRSAKGEPVAEMESEQGDQVGHKFPDVLDRSGWDGVV